MTVYPQAKDTDPEEVTTLLEMGAMLSRKGDIPDALRFLERAVDACPVGMRRAELAVALSGLRPPVAPRTPAPGETTLVSKPTATTQRNAPRAVVVDTGPVSEAMLSEADLVVDSARSDVTTQRFDYEEALQHGSLAPPAAEPDLPPNILPAVRVWIVPGKEGGRVVIAEGPRPLGAADAILLSVVPGADLPELLKRRALS